jgi:hypothetical protein
MAARLRPLLWPAVIALIAVVAYNGRISREMPDFGVYRTAAARAVAAEPLYRVEDGHYQFKYLPAFALAVAPLAMLRPEVAKAAWFALSVGCLLVFLHWSVLGLPERRRTPRVLTWLTVLFMAKFYAHELLLGQSNLLLGVLLVAALLAAQIELPRVAGVLIALAAFIKPYALLLLPWLIVSHGLTAGLVSVAVIALGLLVPAILYGWSGNLMLLGQWYATVSASTAPNLIGADNISLAAMWAKWIGPGSTAAMLAVISAMGALALAAMAWRRRDRVAEGDYLEVALLMLLIPLLSPQGWDYVLLLATPAVVCLLDRWPELSRPWRVFSIAVLAIMGLTIFDLMGRTLYARFMALSIVTVCALGVAVALSHVRRKGLA